LVDEARFGDLPLRTKHGIEQIDQDRIKVVYRMEITGSRADEAGRRMGPASPLTGPSVSAGRKVSHFAKPSPTPRPWTRSSRWQPPYALRL
jgi:hypothetical protein